MAVAHVTRADAARIDEVASLWKELQAHHASGAEHLGAQGPGAVRRFRSGEESWQIRRAQYLEYLAGALPAALFLAERAGVVVGYAMARAIAAGPTIETGETIGHLESLAVLPDYRSAGVGRQLLGAVWAVLREWGTTEVTVNVMAGNSRAEEIYRRMGLVPFSTTLVGRVG
jgi:ribosomal protein S18 acetylase RimI-like enzyme